MPVNAAPRRFRMFATSAFFVREAPEPETRMSWHSIPVPEEQGLWELTPRLCETETTLAEERSGQYAAACHPGPERSNRSRPPV